MVGFRDASRSVPGTGDRADHESGLREASIRVWQRRPLRVAFINETAVRAFAPVALITLFVAEYQLEHRATDLLFAAATGACIGTATLSFTSASTHIRLKLSGSLVVYVVTLAACCRAFFSGAWPTLTVPRTSCLSVC